MFVYSKNKCGKSLIFPNALEHVFCATPEHSFNTYWEGELPKENVTH